MFVGVAYFLAGYYPSPGHFFLFVAVYGMCQVHTVPWLYGVRAHVLCAHVQYVMFPTHT